MYTPVGIKARSRGFNVIGSDRFARKSMPADEGVLYEGSGLDDLFMILTFTVSISLKFLGYVILCENNKNLPFLHH